MTTPKSRRPTVFRIDKKQSSTTAEPANPSGQQDLSGSLHLQEPLKTNSGKTSPVTEPIPGRPDPVATAAKTQQPKAQQARPSRKPAVVKTASLAETPFPVETAPHIEDDGSDDYMQNDWEQNHNIASAAIPSLDDIKKGLRWGNIFFSAISALAGLIVLGWVTSYINELYKRHDMLGWITLGVVSVICLAFLAIIIKEFWSMRRLKNMNRLRIDAELAVEKNDSKLATEVVGGLKKILGHRKDLKWAFGRMKEHEADIRNGREIITLTERELMKPLDIQARQIVANAAKRVSVVTAISPFAILDMGFVAYSNIKMLRSLNLLYGGKPGTFSTFRIIGMIVTHLAIAGGAALAEDMMKHVLTTSMAAKLSARLGQGLLNGGLTARIGIVATTLMRPLPYIERKPPNFKAMVKEVFRTGK